MAGDGSFSKNFRGLTGFDPMPWQEALYSRFVAGDIPPSCSLPTGLGKTSVIAIWLIALANHPKKMPRRLVYVVNRRTVVDQTTDEVEKHRRNLKDKAELKALRSRLGPLAISTLRGQFADNREWSADPSRPAVICGTVDMIGSRLLFSGYRIGFKSKPLHAGFLGQDVLVVHDEAHLEPAFQALILRIQHEQSEVERTVNLLWPKLRVMALSATVRDAEENTTPLSLTRDDVKHPIVKRRIHAVKKVHLHAIDDKEMVGQIVDRALKFKKSSSAVLVFARSVRHVEQIVEGLTKFLKKDGLSEHVVTLTGTMRGLERDGLVKNQLFQRFLPKSSRDADVVPADGTVYLVCTSAGEVGVNISADHLICDLSTFDSMAQRFGRVNRFGDCNDTKIHVVHPGSFGGKGKFSELDRRRQKTLKLLRGLDGDASPAALEKLDAQARRDAFAPEPTILPATDILFDAWTLTTIREKMPGRPPVEPYLHGISEWEPPQTQVAWREEVGIITGDLLDRYKLPDLLDDYPLKPHELLRDRSDRVFDKLQVLASSQLATPVWLIDSDGRVMPTTLGGIADPAATKKALKSLRQAIEDCTVLLPPSVGGLSDGLLDGKSESADDVADQWFEIVQRNGKDVRVQRRIRVWDDDENFAEKTKDMQKEQRIGFSGSEDDEDAQGRSWYWYVRPWSADHAGSSNADKPITLEHHTSDVVLRATKIVKSLGLADDLKQAIILAAKLHDLGKKRELWQRSIGHQLQENPKPEDWLAKSGGNRSKPGFPTNYRHEFGSLLDALDSEQKHLAQFEQLGDKMKDLVLHLIAAHHGRARPHFPRDESYDPAPGSDARATEQAMETPRRFARLQRKYGRWGLAYLESLLRAADWAASAEPSAIEEDNS